MSVTDRQSVLTLRETWSRPHTFVGWLTDVGHRSIGIRYVITGMVFFALGGAAALTMRAQLSVPQNRLLAPERYDQLFTMHGVTMMFLFAVPIMEGFALYLIPLTLGTRELAFPRLNAFGYWTYLIGGIVLWTSFVLGTAPDAGWFDYPPLASARFDQGTNIDVYVTAIPLLEIAAVTAAIELVATILSHRAPGMSLNRIPLYAWSVLVMAGMIIVAMPPLIADCLMLLADRNTGTHFFDPLHGGDPLLWQHLFWFFGHPEVYIMLLPGLGIVATITSTFARRPTAGYTLVVFSYVAIGAISFAVWGHHMFATGEPTAAMAVFSAATVSIVIPSGIQIFSLFATLWHGRVRLGVPLVFVLGYVFVFVAGGLTGVEIASIPFDLQVHDSYFIVAHFHYTLLGGVVLPFLAGIYYWFPKMTGRMLDDRLGIASFVLIFAGINATFFPMHLAGLAGMPRRVYTYPAGMGWDGYQAIASAGSAILALGMLTYLVNMVLSLRLGPPAGANPWAAGTIEWMTNSPPTAEAFAATPIVQSAYPLWDADAKLVGPETLDPERDDRRETLGTSIIEGHPEQRTVEPGPTLIPLMTAACLAVTLVGALIDPLISVTGLVLTAVTLLRWLAPPGRGSAGPANPALPTSWEAASHRLKTPAQYGLLAAFLAVGAFDLAILSGYWYLAQVNGTWPVPGVGAPAVGPAIAASVLVAAGLGCAWVPRLWPGRHGRTAALFAASGAATLLAGAVVTRELLAEDWNWATNSAASAEWAVLLGWLLLAAVFVVVSMAAAVYAARGAFSQDRVDGLVICSWSATFTAAVWAVSAVTIELGPRLL